MLGEFGEGVSHGLAEAENIEANKGGEGSEKLWVESANWTRGALLQRVQKR